MFLNDLFDLLDLSKYFISFKTLLILHRITRKTKLIKLKREKLRETAPFNGFGWTEAFLLLLL